MGRAVICWCCQLSDMLDALLAGPDGQIPAHMRPLVAALLGMPRPLSGYAWIRRNPRPQDLLRGLATREVDLNHAALDALPPPGPSSTSAACSSTTAAYHPEIRTWRRSSAG
jgi:hypothetical protein